MRARDFYLQVAYALSGCQLVEQELKLYISDALELARKCIGNRMTFKLSGDAYEDASLERLIETFKNFSSNAELISALAKFKKERNFLSHRGITYCMDYDHDLSLPEISEMQPRLKSIQEEAERLRQAIHEEANNFRGHLWFGEFDEAVESA